MVLTRDGRRKLFTLMVALVAAACSGDGGARPIAAPLKTPLPVASHTLAPRLCQPFPDRLIDEFVRAYNGRDLQGLQRLVTATGVEDMVSAAYSGESSFADVGEWARASWDGSDRIDLVGYSAFHPTKHGFQMIITRAGDSLKRAGIGRVSMTLDAVSTGCTISRLRDSGPVQAEDDPCAFYDQFQGVPAVFSAVPRACADGSADHARTGAVATRAGDQVLVWGGERGGSFTFGDIAMDGLAFDPATNRWERIPAPDLPDLRPEVGVWTGAEMIVLGSKARPNNRVVASAFDPDVAAWRSIEFPFKRSGFEGVWTGTELLLWGGPRSEHPPRRGLLYDPVADSWRTTSPAPVSGRWSHSVVWTGTELLVWGGGNARSDLANGAAYAPATDTWRRIADSPLSPRQWLPLVWTGREMLAWGGSSISRAVADGAAYDPASDSWRKLARSPLRGRYNHSAVWTGSEMIVFGGYNYRRSFADGASYDPVLDRWRRLPSPPIDGRFDHASVWTGTEMLVFGGLRSFGHIALGDGATFDPVTDQWERVVPSLGPES